MPKSLFAIAVLALAFSAPALAADATIVSRDVPLHGERVLMSRTPPARFNLVGLHWRGSGTVQFRTRSLGGRMERLACRGTRGGGPSRSRNRRARPRGYVAARQPLVGRRVRPDRVPPPRTGDAAARALRLEPARGRSRAHAAEGRGAGDRAPERLERRREDQAWQRRPSRPSCGSRSCTTRPARTVIRPRSPRRSCAGSSCTTSRATAGTTSATTFSSTGSAPCSRAATAGSSGTSSALTPRDSTPAPSERPSWVSTARWR